MRVSFRLISFVVATALAVGVAGVQPADATPLLVGESLIFNFDYGATNPPPPYQQIATELNMNSFVSGAAVGWQWFTELNGGGTLADFANLPEGFNFLVGGLTQSGLVDGVYSLKVTALNADLDVKSAEGFFANAGDEFYTLGANGKLAIPEPTSLVMLVTGLLSLGWLRRRSG
jgi:hypothetical protein